jgi:hypothetical protein
MTSYRVHRDGVKKAKELIDARQYDTSTSWSEAAPSAEEENAQIERHGYDGYGLWHLAVDTDAGTETKSHYGFPYGDFRRVNRAALIHAKQRASQNGHDEVERAADEVLSYLDDQAG